MRPNDQSIAQLLALVEAAADAERADLARLAPSIAELDAQLTALEAALIDVGGRRAAEVEAFDGAVDRHGVRVGELSLFEDRVAELGARRAGLEAERGAVLSRRRQLEDRASACRQRLAEKLSERQALRERLETIRFEEKRASQRDEAGDRQTAAAHRKAKSS